MAITAATVAKDAILSDNTNLKSLFEQAEPFVTSSSSWVQGDNLCLDASGHYLRVPSSDADGATFVGVAQQSVTAGILVGPYPTGMGTVAAQQPQQLVGPAYGCVVLRKFVASQSLTPGIPVYIPATGDTQTVSIVDGATTGDYIGIYMGAALTSVAGTWYPVLIGAKLATTNTLQF